MTWPNFLVVGASKSGTTTIHQLLSEHPQVYMCPVKEVGFFWSYQQDIQFHGPGTEKLQNRLVDDLDHYKKLFADVGSETAIGESSVRYLYMPQAPQLIHDFIPQVKLIASLRQPADRAFSAFTHNLRDGLEPCDSFAEAIAQDQRGDRDAWTFCRYLDRGMYYQSLKRYLAYFERAHMHISLFEDLKNDAQSLMRSLYQFLDVDESYVPDTSHRHNVSGIIKNPLLRLVWTRSNRLRAAVRPLVSDRLRHAATEWFIRDLEKPHYPLELRAELTEYYRQDILQLQDLVERDLSHWLTEKPTQPDGAGRL
jgi:hypothetical protein